MRRESLEEDYRALYRFNKVNKEWLGESFETRGSALRSSERMRVFLRYIGDPGFLSGVAEDIGINRTTVNKTISQVMTAVLQKKHLWIKFPTSEQEMNEEKIK